MQAVLKDLLRRLDALYPNSTILQNLWGVETSVLDDAHRNGLIVTDKIFNWQPHTRIKIDVKGRELLQKMEMEELSKNQGKTLEEISTSMKTLIEATGKVVQTLKDTDKATAKYSKRSFYMNIAIIAFSALALLIAYLTYIKP